MADTSQLLSFRPRCRPPVPSAVNSWAMVNINVHLEQPARQAAVVNFTHMRNALINARHVLGESEVVDGDGAGLFPAGAGCGGNAWIIPQPTPGPFLSAGMPAPESAHLPSMQDCPPAGPYHGRATQTTSPQNLGVLKSRNQWERQLKMSPAGTHVDTHSALKQPLVTETKQLERPPNTLSVMPASQVHPPSHQQHFQQRVQPPASHPATAPPTSRRPGLGLQAATSSEWDLEFDLDLLAGLDGELEMDPDGGRTRPSHRPHNSTSTGQVARGTADPSRGQECHHQQQHHQQQWRLHKSVTVTAGSASRQPANLGRRNSGELKQAVLVAGGSCALPPQPQLGEAWKTARPGGGVIAASTMAVEQQRQQHCVRTSASLQGPAQGLRAASGATAQGKRRRGDEHGDDAAPLPPRGGVDGKCAKKKKAGGKDADGGAAEALLLSQLLLLCEPLEGPEIGRGEARVRAVSEPQVALELRRDISRSQLLLAGLLVAVSEGPVYQFASNMQSVSKPQREMLLKARRLLAKDPAAAAALNVREEAAAAAATAGEHGGSSSLHTDIEGSRSESRSVPRFGSGVQASEHMERCVGFCVMCLDEQMCKQWLGDSRGCNVTTIGGSTTEAVGSAAGGNATGGTAAPGCVPMYLLPTAVWPPPWSRLGGRSPAGSSGSQSLLPATGPRLPHPTLISLLDDVLVRAPCPVLCCNAKALLREAMSQGWRSPLPQQLRLIDPCVLAWMEAPQLAQRDEKEIEGYSLDTLCPRYGISLQPPQNPTAASGGAATGLPPPPLADGPLARIRRALLAAVKLFEAVRVRVQPWLRPQAVQVEMQVTAVLARMEVLGIAVDAADLSRKAAAVRRRMEALSATASALLGGRPINLGSSVQLAGLLYEELKLPPPVPQGQRDAAAGPGKDRNGRLRTHHSTDEAALKQISHLHPLPALVLQYRSLQNVLSKWLEPEWLPPLLARSGMARAAAFPSASASAICSGAREALPRISCCWNQTATATGRLSSSGPNMQAVTRYEVMVQIEDEDAAVATAGTARGLGMPIAGGATGSAGGGACRKACGCGDDEDTETGQRGGRSMAIVARNAFVAPAGRLLVAADYSQIELRLLAHLSGDLRLQKLLKMGQNGSGGADAFRLIAAAWLRPGTAPADISSRDREQVKRVIYGIIYGMTAQGLAQQLAEYGVGLEEAVALRASFLRHFGGVQAFITSSLHQARRQGYVTTGLLGRRRPIAGVTSTDPRVRAEAERKVVNSIVQGSAADLVKCAMCMWAASNHPDAQQAATLPTCKNRGQAPGRGRGPTTGIGRAQLSTAALIGSHIPGALAARAPAPATPSATGGGTAVPVNIDAELVAQIHDELIFEVDARPEMVRRLVVAVRGIMCHAVVLKVPLLIKVAAGRRWGELQELPAGFGEETS